MTKHSKESRYQKIDGYENYWIEKMGSEGSSKFYELTEEKLLELIKIANFRDNKVVKDHMIQNIFPCIAYYLALQQLGYEKDKALQITADFMGIYAEKMSKSFDKFSKIPFIYGFLKLIIKPMMKRNFPAAGWKTEWVTLNQEGIAFNLHSCLYFQVLNDYGCPELGTYFCKNDDICYAKLAPKVLFQRSKTIARGGKYCDFKFIKG